VACALALALCAAPASALSDGPYALHSMLQLGSSYALKQAMFAEGAAAGASEIRVDISLGELNSPYVSSAMWSAVDDYMQLSRRYRINVLADLSASNDPRLESCGPGVDPSAGLCGVTDLNGYFAEVSALVQHVRGTIDDFEIVNEPDAHEFFAGTPQQYAGMLATAYQAVHQSDPAGRVLLGGEGGDGSWIATAFATPGFNAAHAFDIANVHVRAALADVPGAILAWRQRFAFFGDAGVPLWVTETGYPSDPIYQYDPAFQGFDETSGEAEQAVFLARALPTMLRAGAAKVFVTERDNLSGQYASEGLIGGHVSDADGGSPTPVPKPAYHVFTLLSQEAGALRAPAAPQPNARPGGGAPAHPLTTWPSAPTQKLDAIRAGSNF
jgi:hypothetical protein